jgi:hypothetical protein
MVMVEDARQSVAECPADVAGGFKPNKKMNPVWGRESTGGVRLVLVHAADQIVGHPYVECPMFPACQDVNVVHDPPSGVMDSGLRPSKSVKPTWMAGPGMTAERMLNKNSIACRWNLWRFGYNRNQSRASPPPDTDLSASRPLDRARGIRPSTWRVQPAGDRGGGHAHGSSRWQVAAWVSGRRRILHASSSGRTNKLINSDFGSTR